ncbi:hypothetical protein FHT00_002190 [Sphingomonas insulae]|uniref:Uncharacterized protein n=1 Tax=Sphingomonas insulae TaxID=424800 RepID=A0ABN1HLL0_9SPHN|nr:hypothetical protein [Sphingomonas insulae]NIJ30227.1 hypothetical protein [Sphingomonas insulae]
MKTITLAPALALATLGLAACGPKTDAGNNTVATDTLTLNEEGDAGLGNSDALDVNRTDTAPGNDAAAAGEPASAPAEGNTR